MSKSETSLMKKTAQYALKADFGFCPSLANIVLLEGKSDRTYILFRVGQWEYEFSSYKLSDGSIWCGQGHIKKTAVYSWTGGKYERFPL